MTLRTAVKLTFFSLLLSNWKDEAQGKSDLEYSIRVWVSREQEFFLTNTRYERRKTSI